MIGINKIGCHIASERLSNLEKAEKHGVAYDWFNLGRNRHWNQSKNITTSDVSGLLDLYLQGISDPFSDLLEI